MKKLVIFYAISFAFIISVSGQNLPPVSMNDTVETMSQMPLLIDVLMNDFDPDFNEIHINHFSNPAHGDVDTLSGKIIYKSDPYEGSDMFRYKIKDNGIPPMISQYAFVNINVISNPDIPVAIADTFDMMELVPYSVNLVNNDFDPNNDAIKIHSIKNTYFCSVDINEDSLSVTVKPEVNSSGIAFFHYNVIETNSGNNFQSKNATVFLNVIDNPDIPVSVNDSATATGGISLEIPVLDNDYDLQGDPFEIFSFTQPGYSSIHVTQSGNKLLLAAPFSYTGKTQFTYNIRETTDTTIYSANTLVKVFVNKNPNCPVAVADNVNATTAIPVLIEVLQNDYDLNGDPFELMSTYAQGGFSSVSGNKISYTSSPYTLNYDTIYYSIRQTNDTTSFSEMTPVYVQLSPNPEMPVANTDRVTTRSGMPVDIFPLTNDINNTADTLIIQGTQGPVKKGRIISASETRLTYVPYYRSVGLDSILYIIKDKHNSQVGSKGMIYITVENQHYYDSLTICNVNAGVNANGYLFSKIDELPGTGSNEIDPHFKYPMGSQKSTIFTNSLWIGGVSDGELHLAGERYKQGGVDFQAGPVADIYDSAFYLKFARTWKLSKQEVEYHKQHYTIQGYEPIEVIASWPGNGNPALGQAEKLAPFYDLNNDGLYLPSDGDYPLIRGDQSVFFIYNDDLLHTESGGEQLGLEIHGMVYGFDQQSDTVLNNSVFVHYDIINRSTRNYGQTYIGVFNDFDIGYANDDYIACNVMRKSFIAYNGKPSDGNGEAWAYGENPPAQSATLLAGPYMDDDGIDNPYGGCDESFTGFNFGNDIIDDERLGLTSFIYFNNNTTPGGGDFGTDPLVASEYYNYMKGIWRDLTPLLYGGNGHESNSVGPQCKFMFPGGTDPINFGTSCHFPNDGYNQGNKFWTEEESQNTPYDRRGLGVMGPFTFESGEVQEIEIAFCIGQGNEGVNSSVEQLLNNLDSLIADVGEGGIIIPNNELGIRTGNFKGANCHIYPNPAQSMIVIETNLIHPKSDYSIFNMMGSEVLNGKLLNDTNISLDISSLHPGIYLIQIISDDTFIIGKFIRK